MSPLGCAPTSSATPPKPTSSPTSLPPVTTSDRLKRSASSAVNSGADAWITAVNPESIRFSAQEMEVIGIEELTSPTTTSGPSAERVSRMNRRAPVRATANGASARAPMPSRRQTSVVGASSRTQILMNMNDAPQRAASASSMRRWRRLISLQTRRGRVWLPG
jgi:hypothetical protein